MRWFATVTKGESTCGPTHGDSPYKPTCHGPQQALKSIVGGTSSDETARSVLLKVQEKFMEMGKVNVGSNASNAVVGAAPRRFQSRL